MPIKINELVIQVKVREAHKQEDQLSSRPTHLVLEQQKLALLEACLSLLEEREVR